MTINVKTYLHVTSSGSFGREIEPDDIRVSHVWTRGDTMLLHVTSDIKRLRVGGSSSTDFGRSKLLLERECDEVFFATLVIDVGEPGWDYLMSTESRYDFNILLFKGEPEALITDDSLYTDTNIVDTDTYVELCVDSTPR